MDPDSDDDNDDDSDSDGENIEEWLNNSGKKRHDNLHEFFDDFGNVKTKYVIQIFFCCLSMWFRPLIFIFLLNFNYSFLNIGSDDEDINILNIDAMDDQENNEMDESAQWTGSDDEDGTD